MTVLPLRCAEARRGARRAPGCRAAAPPRRSGRKSQPCATPCTSQLPRCAVTHQPRRVPPHAPLAGARVLDVDEGQRSRSRERPCEPQRCRAAPGRSARTRRAPCAARAPRPTPGRRAAGCRARSRRWRRSRSPSRRPSARPSASQAARQRADEAAHASATARASQREAPLARHARTSRTRRATASTRARSRASSSISGAMRSASTRQRRLRGQAHQVLLGGHDRVRAGARGLRSAHGSQLVRAEAMVVREERAARDGRPPARARRPRSAPAARCPRAGTGGAARSPARPSRSKNPAGRRRTRKTRSAEEPGRRRIVPDEQRVGARRGAARSRSAPAGSGTSARSCARRQTRSRSRKRRRCWKPSSSTWTRGPKRSSTARPTTSRRAAHRHHDAGQPARQHDRLVAGRRRVRLRRRRRPTRRARRRGTSPPYPRLRIATGRPSSRSPLRDARHHRRLAAAADARLPTLITGPRRRGVRRIPRR